MLIYATFVVLSLNRLGIDNNTLFYFIDDSKYGYLYFINEKLQSLYVFKDFKAEIEN